MQKTGLSAFFDYCTVNNLPFACYRLPENRAIQVIAQKNSTLLKLPAGTTYNSKKGFLFAPFIPSRQSPRLLIRADVTGTGSQLPALNFSKTGQRGNTTGIYPGPLPSTKAQYQNLVSNMRKVIRAGKFKKIVAACVTTVARPARFNAAVYFEKLCKAYPGAFVSMVYAGPYGLWIGASPEILLQVNNEGFKTYSLAGTRAYNPQTAAKPWGLKEQEEQQLVTDYLLQNLSTVVKHKPQVNGPATVTAGNLQHLLTAFNFKRLAKSKWQQVAEMLHPTPAVAGLPKHKAARYITANELSPRLYYSGYLGPVNLQGQVNLFVNLRCMQVLQGHLAIYTGCGITAQSSPAGEWKETRMKTRTLLNVLKK